MLTVNDLCYSETFEKMGIENKPIHYAVKQNLKVLCKVLNAARIPRSRIISAYRCPALNKVIGGALFSKHLEGTAVDISCENTFECISTISSLYAEACRLNAYVSYFYMSRTGKKIHIDFNFTQF